MQKESTYTVIGNCYFYVFLQDVDLAIKKENGEESRLLYWC